MLMEPIKAPAHRLPCACLKSISGLRRLDKTLNFLRCINVNDQVLEFGSDINERNWLQLLFYFIKMVSKVVSVVGTKFFTCVSGFRLKFSRIALWRKRMQLDSKSGLTTNGLIPRFFVGKWFLSWTHYLYGLKSARTAHLLFFFEEINFFRYLVCGVFWSVL